MFKPLAMRNLYHFKGISGFSIDSRSIKKGRAFIAIKGKYADGHDFISEAVARGASAIIASRPGVPSGKVPFFLASDSAVALAEAIKYQRRASGALVYAITGSLGKTTTKEMLAWLISESEPVLKSEGTENNLFGLAKAIFRLDKQNTAALELGTNSKGEIRSLSSLINPDIGVITFIKPVHLEGLGNLEGVYREKISLIESNPRMKLVLNADDPYLAASNKRRETYYFGKAKNNDLFFSFKERKNNRSLFLIQDKYEFSLAVHQEPFISNVMAAILAAQLKGLRLERLISRISQFTGFPQMRMQMKKVNNLLILNDSYNANPYSFRQALKVLENYSLDKIAVIGDMLELGKKSRYYHLLLAGQVLAGKFQYCLTFGKDSFCLHEELRRKGYNNAFHFSSHSSIADFIGRKTAAAGKRDKKYLVFLKGSRAIGLEKIADLITKK